VTTFEVEVGLMKDPRVEDIIYIASNADGRRENNVTREEWREYRLLMKLMQMQL